MYSYCEVVMKAKIIQPEGVKYLIQEYHYSKAYAQEYVDMLISKMERYIERKRNGSLITLMSLEQMEIQLVNMKQFQVVEYSER